MNDLPDLVILARVIDRASFARAAIDLGVPSSTVSRRVAALESRLGVRAIERTTRRLRATEIGELLAQHGRRVRAELEEAERAVADHRDAPRGILRLAIPSALVELLGHMLAELLARYPELRIDLAVSDAPAEMLAGGCDAALHGGHVRSSATYGITRLGHISPILAASSRYLEGAPKLRHPRDLADPAHTIVARSRRPRWQFVHMKAGDQLTVTPAAPRAVVATKSFGAELVAAGVGIAILPRAAMFTYRELRVLEPGGYRPPRGPFSIVTPSTRTAAPKVRAFVDAMRAYIATRPDLFD
jgi:DNA-binding transcriptional LysR family regulator